MLLLDPKQFKLGFVKVVPYSKPSPSFLLFFFPALENFHYNPQPSGPGRDELRRPAGALPRKPGQAGLGSRAGCRPRHELFPTGGGDSHLPFLLLHLLWVVSP